MNHREEEEKIEPFESSVQESANRESPKPEEECEKFEAEAAEDNS